MFFIWAHSQNFPLIKSPIRYHWMMINSIIMFSDVQLKLRILTCFTALGKLSKIIFGPKLLKSHMVLPGFCKPTLNSVLCTGWREKNCAKIAEICLPRLSIEKLDSFFMNSNCGKETKLLFFCNKEQQNTYLHRYEKIHF